MREELDAPDDETTDHSVPKVLVPPAGVHTPADTLHGDGTTAMVAAPADAISDPQGTCQAVADAAAGNTTAVSRDQGFQHGDGSAISVEEHDARSDTTQQEPARETPQYATEDEAQPVSRAT